MADQTPILGYPFPDFPDSPVVPTDVKNLAVAVEGKDAAQDSTVAAINSRVSQNEVDISGLQAGGGSFPIGAIVMTARSVVDVGWLFCRGQLESANTYRDLFDAIGYTYGGSGSSFRMPDMIYRAPVGAGGGAVLGPGAGAFNVTLTTLELPFHVHQMPHTHGGYTTANGEHSHKVDRGSDSGKYGVVWDHGGNTGSAPVQADGDHQHLLSTNSQSTNLTVGSGGGRPFSIMQPYTILNFQIRH